MINVIEIGIPSLELHIAARADIVVENVALFFIVVFRFYFLAMIRSGWRSLWRFHRGEVGCYLLFMTHEYPFVLLKHYTKLDWEHVQGAYNRLTIALCLSCSIRARFASEGTGPRRSAIDASRDPCKPTAIVPSVPT
ncbi:hypothetical protein PINS_up007077 [Pythium insidiosum]|nr:hypothetical protein PINS_up007077 [Pythium insidiosum]